MAFSQRRVLPHNLEAEVGVIATLMLDPHQIDAASRQVDASMFYADKHREIYLAIVDLGDAADLITVTDRLRQRGKLGDCGGPTYIASLPNAIPSTGNLGNYAEIVRRCHLQRALITTGLAIADLGQAASESEKDVLGAVAQSEQLLRDTRSLSIATRGVVRFSEVLGPSIAGFEEAKKTGNAGGITFGLKGIDAVVPAQQPGNFIVLVGPSSHGKSLLAGQWGEHASQWGPALICGNEQNVADYQDRLLIKRIGTGLTIAQLRAGDLKDDEWPLLAKAAAELSELPLYARDNVRLMRQVWDAAAEVREREGSIAWLCIDWIQKMIAPNSRSDRRVQELDSIVDEIVDLAKTLQIPVVGVAQYGKIKEGRSPSIDDIRDTERIRQASDYTFQLSEKKGKTEPNRKIGWNLSMVVGKARQSERDVEIPLWFDAKRLAITDAPGAQA
jgi:replicative DNA helicase